MKLFRFALHALLLQPSLVAPALSTPAHVIPLNKILHGIKHLHGMTKNDLYTSAK